MATWYRRNRRTALHPRQGGLDHSRTLGARRQSLSMTGRCEFVPMQAGHLDWIEVHEASLHAFPWSRGNFLDSLAAGHGAWILKEEGCMLAYAIVLTVLDEAHLLNISVIRSAQQRGLGRIFSNGCMAMRAARGRHSSFWKCVRPIPPPCRCIGHWAMSRSACAKATIPQKTAARMRS